MDQGLGMMGAVLPMVSGLLQEALRRITITVEWQQGSKERKFVLSQFVVHPTQGPLELMHKASAMQDAQEEAEMMQEDLNDSRSGGRSSSRQPRK